MAASGSSGRRVGWAHGRGRAGLAVALVAAIAAGSALFAPAPAAAATADWPQYRGGADHRGWNRAESTISAGNVARLRPVWIDAVLHHPPVEPLIVGDRLFVVSHDATNDRLTLKAKDLRTRATHWSRTVYSPSLVDGWGNEYNNSPRLAVAAGRVFLAAEGTVYAFEVSSGRRLWAFDEFGFGVRGIVVDGGTVTILVQQDSDDIFYDVVRVDAANGQVQARTFGGDGQCCLAAGPATKNGVTYLDAGGLVALTGSLRPLAGFAPTTASIYRRQPAVTTDLVYTVEGDSSGPTTPFSVIAADARTGRLRWSRLIVDRPDFVNDGLAGSNLAVDSDRVYVHYRNEGDVTATLAALDRWSGAVVWTRPSVGNGAPTVANGVVYVAERDRGVAAYRATTGAELWRHPGVADGSDPVVANGKLVVGLRAGGNQAEPANLTLFELAS